MSAILNIFVIKFSSFFATTFFKTIFGATGLLGDFLSFLSRVDFWLDSFLVGVLLVTGRFFNGYILPLLGLPTTLPAAFFFLYFSPSNTSYSSAFTAADLFSSSSVVCLKVSGFILGINNRFLTLTYFRFSSSHFTSSSSFSGSLKYFFFLGFVSAKSTGFSAAGESASSEGRKGLAALNLNFSSYLSSSTSQTSKFRNLYPLRSITPIGGFNYSPMGAAACHATAQSRSSFFVPSPSTSTNFLLKGAFKCPLNSDWRGKGRFKRRLGDCVGVPGKHTLTPVSIFSSTGTVASNADNLLCSRKREIRFSSCFSASSFICLNTF